VASSHAEIVEEICDHLRPWKQKRCEADIRSEVEKRIALLVRIAAGIDQWPCGADVRRQAAEARKTLVQLRDQLAREPLRSHPPLVARWQFVDLDLLDETLAKTKSKNMFPDPRSNPMQRICADSADALIYQLSKKPATGTAEESLHAIASLLFEAVTGKPDQNLKRAVDAMIKAWRKPGLDRMGGRGRPPGRAAIKRDKWEHDLARVCLTPRKLDPERKIKD
jgi:hypothetical protein